MKKKIVGKGKAKTLDTKEKILKKLEEATKLMAAQSDIINARDVALDACEALIHSNIEQIDKLKRELDAYKHYPNSNYKSGSAPGALTKVLV